MCALFLCLKVDWARVAEFIQKQKQKQCNKYSCKCAFKCNYTYMNTDTTHTHTHSAYFCYVFVSLTHSLSLSAALSLARSRPKSHNFPIKRKWAIYLPWNQWESPIKISSFCRTRRSACCCCCYCHVVVVVLLWLLLFFALVAESATRNVCRRCNYLLCAWQWRQAGEWGATASECLHEEVCLGQAERAGGSYSSCCHCCGWITVAVCVCGCVCAPLNPPGHASTFAVSTREQRRVAVASVAASVSAAAIWNSVPQCTVLGPRYSPVSVAAAVGTRLVVVAVVAVALFTPSNCCFVCLFFCNFSAEHSLCFFLLQLEVENCWMYVRMLLLLLLLRYPVVGKGEFADAQEFLHNLIYY